MCIDNGLKERLGEVVYPQIWEKQIISAIEHLEKRLIGEDPWESEKWHTRYNNVS